jgi:hypothetical protein
MKYFFLFVCLILCSCEPSRDGDCVPIEIDPNGLSFDSQEGIDSTVVSGYEWWVTGVWKGKWWFTGVWKKEQCEFIGTEKIKCHWFSAEKANDSTIVVSVKQNDTGEKRSNDVYIRGNDGRGKECSENSGVFTIFQCSLDSIKLSKEELLFRVEEGIDSITVTNNRSHYLRLYGDGIAGGPESVPHNFKTPYIVEGSWFTISIPDEKKVIFSVNKNETGKERSFVAILDPGICGDSSVKVIQSAE